MEAGTHGVVHRGPGRESAGFPEGKIQQVHACRSLLDSYNTVYRLRETNSFESTLDMHFETAGHTSRYMCTVQHSARINPLLCVMNCLYECEVKWHDSGGSFSTTHARNSLWLHRNRCAHPFAHTVKCSVHAPAGRSLQLPILLGAEVRKQGGGPTHRSLR